mmetsp:Transcript_10806/g.15926  ORF Transcript_10806/g.15926 Transcript_10806/m.15926 type:complete len:393 (+) Transcript_10806:217-1395(+)|eukprot:CAMPEP_0194229848 /NCGR_PEP_ID=MMETSP0156-20130528/44103_1 /TAXON_ID=33649 /ORGANISM="Thalassionema nitzschioides, Strain L26-B" /LENGTH=392 /DNA_ID=CAMNT_0038962411 /DNA_START=134 /DNA_END=1312 /DNA_ORIENTATION=-
MSEEEQNIQEDAKHVNLLDLAGAAVAATAAAARPIRDFVSDNNARLKLDGSIVTDADLAAQAFIVHTLRQVSSNVAIIGEEAPEEMSGQNGDLSLTSHNDYISNITRLAKEEVRNRYHGRTECPLAECSVHPVSQDKEEEEEDNAEFDESSLIVDANRVRVFVDPLDGTKAYASGDYSIVTILIAIILDGQPTFGVIAKPFRYNHHAALLDTNCVVVYGGVLLHSHVYFAGVSESCSVPPLPVDRPPRAIISSSRNEGVVKDFCTALAKQNLIHPDPLNVSGAGEKSLRLIVGTEQERLWFFPRSGTSRWDVAATDALLRAMGGKLTNQYGQELDYGLPRQESENTEGIVASNDAGLHAECIRLFREQLISEGHLIDNEKLNDIQNDEGERK